MLRQAALLAFSCAQTDEKLALVLATADIATTDTTCALTGPETPGRPARPELIPATQVPRRRLNTVQGRAAMIHALCHIEFNAINLALDAVWRFAGMPMAFYADWARVAREEAFHFGLLRAHLRTLGHDYGDFPAHNGLWEMAELTRDDLVARLALVPRTLEARGLDASPLVRGKLMQAGDAAAAAILDIILRDEIGHVSIGNHWYRWLCSERGLDPVRIYPGLAQQYRAPRLNGPFNMEARLAAGFVQEELDALVAAQARPAPQGPHAQQE